MTPEEQREAIASQIPNGFLEGQRWLFNGQWIIFDPLNDLNAMHEAEKVLTQDQWETYIDNLRLVIAKQHEVRGSHGATAAQRAEAFLRSLNLWKP